MNGKKFIRLKKEFEDKLAKKSAATSVAVVKPEEPIADEDDEEEEVFWVYTLQYILVVYVSYILHNFPMRMYIETPCR